MDLNTATQFDQTIENHCPITIMTRSHKGIAELKDSIGAFIKELEMVRRTWKERVRRYSCGRGTGREIIEERTEELTCDHVIER